MTEQKKSIIQSADYLKSKNPFKKIRIGLITYFNPKFLSCFDVKKSVKIQEIPPHFELSEDEMGSEILFTKLRKTNIEVVILNGRMHYYSGHHMKDLSHFIYVFKHLGVKKLILVDEVGHLNPRFSVGGISLIYDHINLMGDNPLIGENDDTLGTRFPDMSNAYNSALYNRVEKYLIESKHKFFPSVYLGISGPETETEAECRFFRDIGADVLGYALVPENIALVHASLECAAFGMISRELVADRLQEISAEEKLNNRVDAEKQFSKILPEIIKII